MAKTFGINTGSAMTGITTGVFIGLGLILIKGLVNMAVKYSGGIIPSDFAN